MNRLIHSSSALLRALQMSAAQVFVFVEGKTDVYFYSKICKAVCDSLAVSYEIHSLQQLGGSGGKLGLLALHDQLEQNKSLVDTRFGKTTVCLFYLDKDTESSRKLRRSRHIAYTLYYTLENHIFLEANVTEAIRIAASLDTSYTLPNSKDLCRLASVHWKEWSKLCLLAYTKGIGSDCGYHSISRINTEPNGSISQTEYTKYQGILQSRGGLSQNDFDLIFQRISRLVDFLYRQGKQDLVFKGKWYSHILSNDIEHILGTVIPNLGKYTPDELTKISASSLDFNQDWAEHFKKPLREVIGFLPSLGRL